MMGYLNIGWNIFEDKRDVPSASPDSPYPDYLLGRPEFSLDVQTVSPEFFVRKYRFILKIEAVEQDVPIARTA